MITTYVFAPVLIVAFVLTVVAPAYGYSVSLPAISRNAPTTAPSATPSDEPSAASTAPAGTHEPVLDGEWADIADAPDSHIGMGYVIHGWITQYDDNTGLDMFLADTGGEQQYCSDYYTCTYSTNAVLTGDASSFEYVTEDVEFSASVTVLGTIDYETTDGGVASAPLLQVDAIDLY